MKKPVDYSWRVTKNTTLKLDYILKFMPNPMYNSLKR